MCSNSNFSFESTVVLFRMNMFTCLFTPLIGVSLFFCMKLHFTKLIFATCGLLANKGH